VDPDHYNDQHQPSKSQKKLLTKTQWNTSRTYSHIPRNHYIKSEKKGYKEIEKFGLPQTVQT
jgi:hypothetical protein